MSSDINYQFDVFISHSRESEEWIRNFLLPELEQAEISACIGFRDFEPGSPELFEIEKSIQNSQKTLLIISSYYLESEWTYFESIMSQSLDISARKKRVIPLLLDSVDLPLRLSMLTYIDFSTPEFRNDQLVRLISAIKNEKRPNLNPKVLLVENEQSWIKITKAILTDCEIIDVQSSSEGISQLKSGTRYDLVITNLNLTDVNEASGEEILEYIRDHRPSLPRIVITGKPIRGPIGSTLFIGYQITEVFTKDDINIPEFRKIVRNIIEPLRNGSKKHKSRRFDLLSRLRDSFDEVVSRLNEGLKVHSVYEVRLSKEIGHEQAKSLTDPGKDALLQRRADYQNSFDFLSSRIMLATELNELLEIEKDFPEGW